MKRLINHPPKVRPFEEPRQKIKSRISALSLNENEKQVPVIVKTYKFPLIFAFVLILPLFILISFVLIGSDNVMIEKIKKKIHTKISKLIKLKKTTSTRAHPTIKFSEFNETHPFSFFIETHLNKFSSINKLSTTYNITITSIFCSLFVLAILNSTNSSNFHDTLMDLMVSFIFVAIFFYSDLFIKGSMTTDTGGSLISISISIEFLLSILLLFSISRLLSLSITNLNLGSWCFWLCLSLFLNSICISFRIEYFVFVIPTIINLINRIRYQFVVIFVFLFVFILNCIYLILIDRFIGLPKISFDSISLSTFAYTLIETDYNGFFLFFLIFLITQLIVILSLAAFSNKEKSKEKKSDNLPKIDIIFILEILVSSLSLLKTSISTIDDGYLSRAYIIRLVLLLITGKLICMNKSKVYLFVLMNLAIFIVIYYSINNLNTLNVFKIHIS